jgi:RNA polymerase sigma-70 factor, ECF subfamily
MIDPAAQGAFSSLTSRLRPFVARRVRGAAEVDDVLQEIFLRMHRGLPRLRDDQRFGPWVYRVARSAIVDHRRAASREPVAASRPTEELPAIEDADAGDRIQRELAVHVAPFVAMLPSPYREALTLTELQGMTQKQAAEMLGVSLSGMKSRVQRGRVRLRELLEDCCKIALDVRGGVLACEPRPGRAPDGCKCDDTTDRPELSGGSRRA